MPKRRPIREKLLLGGLLVGIMVAVLSASGFLGIYSYRRLVRGLSRRAGELPRASALGDAVGRLRLRHAVAAGHGDGPGGIERFPEALAEVQDALHRYRLELESGEVDDVPFGDRSREQATAHAIDASLRRIDGLVSASHAGRNAVGAELERLAALSAALPSYLQEHLHDLASEVRSGYRTLILTTSAAALAAAGLLTALGVLTYRWVFRPLRLLGHGSRRVADGDFDFRIALDTRDEMAELAEALNGMTTRFREIRDDLDRQVQLRTREVIRSEQLASVGFLAAGVAHEINNPLASIAMCAESLEGRLGTLRLEDDDLKVAGRYLELIQSEAFRCKGITERLLDFSRLGEVRRQPTALVGLVRDVAEMLGHVGRFAGRSVEIRGPDDDGDLLVMVNPQEIKQVVLNLLVNALDSIEAEGSVSVVVRREGGEAVLVCADDGCGMTGEVLEHLFEPFFTRRRAGQGTGLGLSIVHRIVADHGGRITASSDGPGHGSSFRLTLPVATVAAVPPPRQARAA
ncbi:MAG: HAMP domain-containing protein [Planctomycetes bacterium]|nr:HAMP domain-containing protein [Planctomycetota bacterium]